jgi:UDP-N-acetylglucosamine:LPS N-acetylglucosamine transferase
MGGGLGVGALEAVAQALITHPLEAQIIFITGSNHGLRRRLKAMRMPWIVRGYVSNMPEWLAVADVAISKAGGLAGSELLAAGVPLIIPRALTGHEALNAQYLTSTGAGLIIDSAAEVVAQADRLLHDPQQRAQMQAAAQRAARPQAASLIAERVSSMASLTHYALRVTNHVDYPALSTV